MQNQPVATLPLKSASPAAKRKLPTKRSPRARVNTQPAVLAIMDQIQLQKMMMMNLKNCSQFKSNLVKVFLLNSVKIQILSEQLDIHC